jgi:pyruvate/2-oxoglutarate dehydrogenase complex dihydrolipoamide dehydrogenase (E3) component
MTEHFSTIVIGAGSGGMTVAIGMAGLGRKVALIEGIKLEGIVPTLGACRPRR